MKKVKLFIIAAAFLVSAAGTMLHFAYENIGGTFWAVIGAVNESTWEHLKLIFWPAFAAGFLEYMMYGKNYRGFISVKGISVFIGMAAIIVLFYTYTGVLGYHILAADIGIFYVSVMCSYLFMYVFLKKEKNERFSAFSDVFIAEAVTGAALLFVIFTFNAPDIALFQDPVTGGRGL